MIVGRPCSRVMCSKMRGNRAELIAVLTAMCTPWRLSHQAREVRTRRPQARASHRQFTDQAIGALRDGRGDACTLGSTSLSGAVAMQRHRVVQPIDSLVIPVWMVLAQPDAARPQLGWPSTSWHQAAINTATRTILSCGGLYHAAQDSPTQRQDRLNGRACALVNTCTAPRF